MGKDTSALDGLSTHERDIMSCVLRMAPEPQKDSPKSATAKGEGQRRRRENERRRLNAASNARRSRLLQVCVPGRLALMRSTTAASTWMKRALHGPPRCALGQRRGDGAIGRTFRGATQSPLESHRKLRARRCRHVANRGATADLSVSRSDLDIDRQVQLDETRLQQRHGQVIVQFNPGVGVAWRPPELLEDDLAGLPTSADPE